MLILYDILYILFIICYLPVMLIRGKLHREFPMRLGIFPQEAVEKIAGRKTIWLHTVSVGEAAAASTLVKHLKKDYPQHCLVVSTVTKTGNRIARKLISSEDLLIYAPLDIGFVVERAVSLIKPQVLIIAETEIWPNLVINLARKNIPVVLINGRISDRSFKGYRIIYPFLKGVLRNFSLFCMQTKDDAQRIVRLGAEAGRVKVTGNMKFDIDSSQPAVEGSGLGLKEDERLFIAGSTHPGEEKIVLEAYRKVIGSHSNLRLLIAPRHIERVKEVEKIISKFGFNAQRISQLKMNLRTANSEPRAILILDTIGQLRSLYSLADIVFIGGSMIAHGGQNPIEPALFGKAIIFGPHMFNFSDVAGAFQERAAALVLKRADDLSEMVLRILDEDGLRESLGKKAKELVQQNRGASFKNVQLIKQFIT